jgi:hypothetical protein
MLIERYCTCGAVLKTNAPRKKKQQLLIVWSNQHSGPGHEETDASGAEAARMGSSIGYGRESEREARG